MSWRIWGSALHLLTEGSDLSRMRLLEQRLQTILEMRRCLALQMQELLLLRRGVHFVRPGARRRSARARSAFYLRPRVGFSRAEADDVAKD